MCKYVVGDYLQLSQVGKAVKSFSIDGGQLVVAEISERRKEDVNKNHRLNLYMPNSRQGRTINNQNIGSATIFFIHFIVFVTAIFQYFK